MLMAVVLTIVLALSCNLVLPERLEITGSPTVDVSVGTVNVVDITGYVDLETMLTDSLSLAFSETGDTFESGDDGTGTYVINARKQLFTQPLADIFDQETGLGGLTQTIEPMTFSAPEFVVSGSYTQTLAGDSITNVTIPALQPVSLVEANVASQILTVPGSGTLDITDFTSMTLAAGSLEVALSTSGASTGLLLEVSSARLLAADDTELAVANISVPVSVNPSGLLVFDLTGVSLPNQIKFELQIGMSNSQVLNPYDLNLAASLQSLDIQSASGLDFNETVSGLESITLDKPVDLVSATIGAGEIVLTLVPPAGFSGVETSLSASLEFEDSQVVAAQAVVPGQTYRFDLAGISLSTFTPASLNYDLTVIGTDATVAFPSDFSLSSTLSITNFTQVVLTATDLDFSYSDPFIIDQAILDAVQAATFSDARLVFNLVNNLPSDLVIDLASSVLLGLTPATLTFTGGSSVPVNQEITLLADAGNSINFATDLVEVSTGVFGIDVDLGVTLSGFDPGLSQLTLTNVVPGEAYSLSGNFELVLDLNTVTLTTVNQTGSFPELGGDPLDFSMLEDFLPAGVNLEGVSTLLELQNTLGLGLDLVLLGRYRESELVPYNYVDLLDDPGDGSTVVVDTDFTSPELYSNKISLAAGTSVPIYLADLVNARAANLELTYSVTFNNAVIDLTMTDAGSIDVFLDLAIPLQLDVSLPEGVYWMPEDDLGNPVLSITEDLFGRETLADSAEMDEIIDFLTSASLRYNLVNTVISGDAGYPEIVIYQGAYEVLLDPTPQQRFDNAIFAKRIPLGGAASINLTASDIDFIQTNLFMPTIELYLSQGLININPLGTLTLDLGLRLETDVVYEYSFGKDDGDEVQ